MGVLKAKVGGVWVPVGVQGGANAQVESGIYVPVLTGMVLGTGGSVQNTASYTYVGGVGAGAKGLLFIQGYMKYGTTGATFPTAPSFSMPPGFECELVQGGIPMGMCFLNDVDTIANSRHGVMTQLSVNSVRPLHGGWDSARNTLSTTTPFTWAINDDIYWSITQRVVRV